MHCCLQLDAQPIFKLKIQVRNLRSFRKNIHDGEYRPFAGTVDPEREVDWFWTYVDTKKSRRGERSSMY